MSVTFILIVFGITVALLALVLFVGKKCCDMAIKPEVARKYSNLIFTPEQKEAVDRTNEEAIKWLQENMIPYYPLGVYCDRTEEEK